MAFLESLQGKFPGQIIELNSERTVLGRHPSCHVLVEDASVSRYHAQILESHGTYYIEDLRSHSGTQLNQSSVSSKTELKDRDILTLGASQLRFRSYLPEKVKALRVSGTANNEFLTESRPVIVVGSDIRHVSLEEDGCIEPTSSFHVNLDNLMALLAKSNIHICGKSICIAFEKAILDRNSQVYDRLRQSYQSIVVFDLTSGLGERGEFDKQKFLIHLWERLAAFSGIPFTLTEYHPELIAQVVQDLKSCLYCFLHVELMKKDMYHHLRGCGFSRQDNRIIYSGNNHLLEEQSSERSEIPPAISTQKGVELDSLVGEASLDSDTINTIETSGSASDLRLAVNPKASAHSWVV